MDYQVIHPQPKPERRATTKRREKRIEGDKAAKVRVYVFGRERNICRICRWRAAESRHELRFRSLGGKITRQNCVAACGDGVRGCHGFAQRNEMAYEAGDYGAEGTLYFTPRTRAAAEWLKVKLGHRIESAPMVQMEAAE